MSIGWLKISITLIELIVVIAIIGVLAAILVPSMIGYVGKSKLQIATSNAKLAFTNTATYCTDCEVAGSTVTGGSAGQTYKKDGTELEKALQSLMGGNPSAGEASIKLNSASVPEATAWRGKSGDKYVGGYPTAATIANGDKGADDDVAIDFETCGKKSGE